MTLPVLVVSEWSTTTPETPVSGQILKNLRLTDADRKLLDAMSRTTLRCTELRSGLSIKVGQHIGTVNLSSLRLVIQPKIRIANLLKMIAYAFSLSDIHIDELVTSYRRADIGLVDLLGLALLREVELIVRGGLLPNYVQRKEDLGTLRGRIDLRFHATHPCQSTLRCSYEDLTLDHELNQILAEGLRCTSRIVQSNELQYDLARRADQFFGDLSRVRLNGERLQQILNQLDRRSARYSNALGLIQLIISGACLGEHVHRGEMPLSGFLLDMNLAFERFLERYLTENCPRHMRISTQESRSDIYEYVENTSGWSTPSIRPDLVIRDRKEVVAIADAKYKNRLDHAPSSGELYQLTTYGLSYQMSEPKTVLMLHPLSHGQKDKQTMLSFHPHSSSQQVKIKLVGVPLDEIMEGNARCWWPLN